MSIKNLIKQTFIIYADLECIIEKTDRCKKGNIFVLVFQCLQYRHLKALKISMMYMEIKLHEKVL